MSTATNRASKAVDGLYSPSQHGVAESSNLAISSLERSPWIQVDLFASYYIYGVKIWQRTEAARAGSILSSYTCL